MSGGFNVIGSHVYAEEGNYTVSTHVADTGGSTANANTSVTVADAPLSASGTSPGNCTEGAVCNLTVATFTDVDPNGVVSDYAATINWGDGTSSSPGTIAAHMSGGFNVMGSNVYAEDAIHAASTHVADSGGSTTNVNTSVAVADAPLSASGTTINATEGTLISNAVMATFTDADPNGAPSDYNAIVDWGDGTRSAATIAANGSGGFNIIGSHIYACEGHYNAQVPVTDTRGRAVNANTTVVVSDATLSISGAPASFTQGIASTFTLANLTNPNSSALLSAFTATINWGDGTSSAGTVSGGSGNFSVSGAHAYAEEGNYNAKIVVTDDGASTVNANITVSVADAVLSPSGTTIFAPNGTPLN